MKGQYNIYPTFTEAAARNVRKAKGKKLPVKDCLSYLFSHVPEMTQSLNYTILSEEHYWMNQSQIVIFPESTDILERLTEAKFNIKKSNGISMPHDSFLLAFPKDFEIADTPANGCMISYMHRSDRFEHIHKPFFKYMGLGEPIFADDRYKQGLYITYQDPLKENTLVRACIPTDIIADCLKAKTAHAYGALVGNFSRDHIKDFIGLNDADLEYQFALFQIVARIGVYAGSCETALRPGYPDVRPKHLEPKGLKYKDYSLGLSNETRDPIHFEIGAHYRSWHFRQLTDKRFYQGVHKKKPIGSRVVFVKDTMVNQNIEAETLT